MNMLDLAEIHAAALGLDEWSGPDVLNPTQPAAKPAEIVNDLRDMIRESEVRRKRIAAARHPWRRKAVRS